MIVGGAAGPIKAFRAKHRLATVATRKKLAEGTSELVNIRVTGYGECLASDAGCGGQGVYELTRCLARRNGVIDSSHVPVRKNILASSASFAPARPIADPLEAGAAREISRTPRRSSRT
jgi:hypothetical protein